MSIAIPPSSMAAQLNNVADTAKTSGIDSALSKDYKKSDEKELMEACRQFEAYFIEQMYSQMKASVNKSDLMEGDSASKASSDYYDEMLTQEYAKRATEGEGIGIARQLFEQMRRNTKE